MDDTVGVIIGRFQVPYLHDGHRILIDRVTERHGTPFFLIGTNELPSTPRNPLPFKAVQAMISSECDVDPENIVEIQDHSEDHRWSENVDRILAELAESFISPAFPEFKLYGSRDSFISHYKGDHECIELAPEVHLSGTQLRDEVSDTIVWDRATREGAIWSASSQFPTSYQAADLAIVSKFPGESWNLIVGQKPGETGWRLPGGFVDPTDLSLEESAAREGFEEVGIRVDPLKLTYLHSKVMDDFRYRSEAHCIKTALFIVDVDNREFMAHEAGDDLARTRAFNLAAENIDEEIRPNHRQLVHAVKDHLWV